MAILSTLFTALIAASSIFAPVYSHDDSAAGIARRENSQIHGRAQLAKCSTNLRRRDIVENRLARRAELVEMHLAKRTLEKRHYVATSEVQAGKNTSQPCLLAPEATVSYGPHC